MSDVLRLIPKELVDADALIDVCQRYLVEFHELQLEYGGDSAPYHSGRKFFLDKLSMALHDWLIESHEEREKRLMSRE